MFAILSEPSSVKDALNLLRKAMRFQRLRNGIKIYRSFLKASKNKATVMRGMPVAASIEPTTSCNLRCPQCPSGLRSFTRDTGKLDILFYEKFIEDNYKTLLYLLLYFQGEPYLHPQFLLMVKIAAKRKIYTATSTNAHYLDKKTAQNTVESGLDRIIISIDGVTTESYKKYRIGGNLEKVLQGTKNLVEAKKSQKCKTPFIIWQFIVFKHNEGEISAVKKLGKQLGVDLVSIKTAQVYDDKGAEELLPKNDQYNRYTKNHSLKLAENNHSKCWKMWHSCVVTWDGNVVPCCFDKDASYQFGNLKTNSLAHIWHNEKYEAFRNTLWQGRKNIPICNNCSEGVKVWEF